MHAVVRRPRAAEIAALMPEKQPPDTSRLLLSPMPGLVVSVDVAEGDEVKAGQPLAVIDAMKMENQLRAERDGRIARICAGAGDSLVVECAGSGDSLWRTGNSRVIPDQKQPGLVLRVVELRERGKNRPNAAAP